MVKKSQEPKGRKMIRAGRRIKEAPKQTLETSSSEKQPEGFEFTVDGLFVDAKLPTLESIHFLKYLGNLSAEDYEHSLIGRLQFLVFHCNMVRDTVHTLLTHRGMKPEEVEKNNVYSCVTKLIHNALEVLNTTYVETTICNLMFGMYDGSIFSVIDIRDSLVADHLTLGKSEFYKNISPIISMLCKISHYLSNIANSMLEKYDCTQSKFNYVFQIMTLQKNFYQTILDSMHSSASLSKNSKKKQGLFKMAKPLTKEQRCFTIHSKKMTIPSNETQKK